MKNLFIFLAVLMLALSSCGAESGEKKQSNDKNWPTSDPSISEPPGPPPY